MLQVHSRQEKGDFMEKNIKYNKSIKQRYDWVDVLKFLGIFSIYLGHCGNSAGKLYPFVFIYHVPLFFFVSGFFAKKDENKAIKEYIVKKSKHLLIPYAFFALISSISFSIANNLGAKETLNMIIKYFGGVRNTLDAASLWFIPCIFIVSLMYFLLTKAFKNKSIVLIVSITLFTITQTILPNNPMIKPSWFMNIDSAMYYIIYYAIGDIIFDKISKFKFRELNLKNKLLFLIISTIISNITIIIYFKGSGNVYNIIVNRLNILNELSLANSIYNVIIAFIIIYFNIIIAFILKEIRLFKVLGANTLLLCCTENIVKVYCILIAEILGISINLYNPLGCVFYTFMMLIIANWISINIFDKYFLRLMDKRKNYV